MADKTTPALFITANVGSIFEEPNVMLKLWTEEFLSAMSFQQTCMKLLVSSCECNTCSNVLKPPVKMCPNGHMMHASCSRGQNCPTCHRAFSHHRFGMIDQVLNIIACLCVHAKNGCTEFVDNKSKSHHEFYCEWRKTVSRLDPKFMALHCQEVGGKNYEQSMKHVKYFVRLLMTSEELRLFDRVRVYLDEDYSSAENFTALGNFYFIHESVPDVLIWDFKELNFVAVEGKDIHSGSIEDVPTKEKSKFPQDFFPECKWSRKGFLRTRWNLNGTIFDLVNIHLFHDASNFVAMETFPSVYSTTRQRALEYTLERFHSDGYGSAPFFLFGDFNFRTDTQAVIKKLANGINPVEVNSTKNNEVNKLLYRNEEQVVLTLGKKEFRHCDHQNVFIQNSGEWLKEFDKELEWFSGQLFEFPIKFPPSYPYEEDTAEGRQYMQTRCPAWCDRVVLSETAKMLVHKIDEEGSVEYGSIGETTCMGDHKPVYLMLNIVSDAGRIVCCDDHPPFSMHASLVDLLLPDQPSVVAKRLERTDSSNSVTLSTAFSSNEQKDKTGLDFDVDSLSIELSPDLTNIKREKLSFSRLSSEGNIGTDFDASKSNLFKLTERQTLPEVEEQGSYDRYIVKRVQSASFVEVARVAMSRFGNCRCMSESQSWRARSASISSRAISNWRANSRIRLISDTTLQNSLLRLQSHHSSSEEDWFEEVSNDENNDDSFEPSKIQDHAQNDHYKIPVLEEISLEEPYEPTQSIENISLSTAALDFKSDPKSKFCCPVKCRRKRKFTKRQRNSIKSNASITKENSDVLVSENDRCCIIS